MPGYINDDEFEDLKSYSMLSRVNGEVLGLKGLYPSDDPDWDPTYSKDRTAKPAKKPAAKTKPAAAAKQDASEQFYS